MRLLILGILAFALHAKADSVADPVPRVTTSESGTFFFKMVPPKGHVEDDKYVINRKPFGVAYRVNEEGEMIELWRTECWHAFEIYLANDGRHLVRMGPWSEGREASTEDLAIAFYEDGKLLKEYSTSDLLKDKRAVKTTVSHYRWRAPVEISNLPSVEAVDPIGPIRLNYDGVIQLRTSEGTIIRFDSNTGKILERKEDPERADLLERFWRH